MRHHVARTEAQEPIRARCSRPVLICSGPPSVSLRSCSSFTYPLKSDTVLVEHGAAKCLRSYPRETLGLLLLGPLDREPGQFRLQSCDGLHDPYKRHQPLWFHLWLHQKASCHNSSYLCPFGHNPCVAPSLPGPRSEATEDRLKEARFVIPGILLSGQHNARGTLANPKPRLLQLSHPLNCICRQMRILHTCMLACA